MSKESKSRILESSCDSKRKKSFSISRYRKPLEDSSTISLYDSTYEEEENTIIFNLPPVDRFSSQQKHPNSTPETTNNCFLLSLRWLCQYLSCFRFRPLILIFFKKKNLNCNSSSNHRSTENQRERSPPISLAVTHNSKQQLDILDINRAQMYPLSRNHDFDLNDRRLSCESTTSPSLVSFNFFPSSPFHSVKTNQFNFEPKYKKFNPTFSSTISQHISKKHFSNAQTLNCSHLSLRGSYTLNRHHNNPFRMSDENSLTDNLSKQKWISEQAMFSRDYQELRDEKRKRTILIKRQDRSYGFTLQVRSFSTLYHEIFTRLLLQTYGIQQKKDGEVELITYVDHVDFGGPACKSGLLEGDVIVSVNGKDMEKADHSTLVNFIKSCDTSMRLVVRFEDCVQKVNLHARFLKMKVCRLHRSVILLISCSIDITQSKNGRIREDLSERKGTFSKNEPWK